MKRDLDILDLIYRATANGAIQWDKLGIDIYRGKFGDGEVQITFQYPMLPDGTTSGADIAQVSVLGLGLTFFSGTAEMDLVRKILAAGNQEWAEWMKHIKERVEEVYIVLKNVTREP